MVSKQLLEELEVILQEEFGVVLKPQDLSEFGNMLVQIFEALSTVNEPKKQIIETTQP